MVWGELVLSDAHGGLSIIPTDAGHGTAIKVFIIQLNPVNAITGYLREYRGAAREATAKHRAAQTLLRHGRPRRALVVALQTVGQKERHR